MQGAILRYIEQRIPPGGCLRAILANDLREAVGRADPDTEAALGHIVTWLYNYAPGSCWGSSEKVDAWLRAEKEAA